MSYIRQADLLYFIVEFKMLTSKPLKGVSCFWELFFQTFLLPIVGLLNSINHLFLLLFVHFDLSLKFRFLDLQIWYFFVFAQSLISVLFEIIFQFLDISLSFLQQILVLLADSLIKHVIQPGNLLFVSNNLILVHWYLFLIIFHPSAIVFVNLCFLLQSLWQVSRDKFESSFQLLVVSLQSSQQLSLLWRLHWGLFE